MMFYRDKCTGCGKCRKICPTPEKCTLCGKYTFYCPVDACKVCGKEYTLDEVFAEIIKDKAFYENSDGGVTFSGGECMLQLCGTHEKIELLPYHAIGENKYRAISQEPQIFKTPDSEKMKQLKEIFA